MRKNSQHPAAARHRTWPGWLRFGGHAVPRFIWVEAIPEVQGQLIPSMLIRSMLIMALLSMTVATTRCDEIAVPAEEYHEHPLSEDQLQHWSMQPVRTVTPPDVRDRQFVRTPIDQFIQSRLEERGLGLQPPATRSVLRRRAALMLTGLLPGVSDHEAAGPPAEFSDEVQQLLQQPAYGERWAQHWLDLARFAETDGYEHDKQRSEAWQYRDWVIRALNRDLGYDQFIRMQIAGDLLSDDPEDAVATHFCVAGPDMPDINLQEERRHTLLNEMTATVGEVFLGLQLGCAQCHDHKYDPISQADFYRLRAVFEPAVTVRKNVSVTRLDSKQSGELISRVMLRGDFRRPGPVVQPAPLRCISSVEDPPLFDRPALARWLSSRRNPLTARVIVNRIWQQHFGRGLCEEPSDLGVMGFEPSHPDLLDWLSGWFMENDWSLKRLHVLLLDSGVWQQRSLLPESASTAVKIAWESAFQRDRDLSLLSRFPRRRLDGEVIRDVLLQISGLLNQERGGPGVFAPLPPEIRATLLKNQWNETTDPAEQNRRSIYVFARRNLRYPIFEAFDRPSANLSCSRRSVSVTAPQSLYLLNSAFSGRIAKELAILIQAESTLPLEQVNAAFQRILRRRPEATEQADAAEFLLQSDENGLASLCLVLINTSEFIYLD